MADKKLAFFAQGTLEVSSLLCHLKVQFLDHLHVKDQLMHIYLLDPFLDKIATASFLSPNEGKPVKSEND